MMDRERKLLYTVAILAPLMQALSLYALYSEADLPAKTAALLETRACQKQLLRSWARCEGKHLHDQRL